MADIFSKEKRSEIMSKIRSEWTKPERSVHGYLKGLKIRHEMHPDVPGSPDLILKNSKTAVFIHGCFWHGCPLHYKAAKSRKRFWSEKIERNALRDRKNIRLLRKNGWKVAVVWEHDLKDVRKSVKRFIG